ncbi:MAG: ABC-2 family transporter protein [Clostridiales bacterium]|nr:ABC-2 family transporter protein [Clostridiales bacterium]
MKSTRNEKYCFMFKMSVSKEMQYRVNFLVSMVSAIIPMGMAVFMWKAVYRETEAVYGYNYTQMILYTILAAIISNLVSAGFASDIASDIKNGELNKFLSQPIGYLAYRFLYFLGGKLVSISVNGIALVGGYALLILGYKLGYSISKWWLATFRGLW